jgi:hypoxanthine phosphoribosyltransferase
MDTIISKTAIQTRVTELGHTLTELYRGKPLTVLGVLNGSVVFVADLIRSINIPHQIGFIRASSYRGESTFPGPLNITTDLMPEIVNRDVLLVDDIFDTGHTMVGLLATLQVDINPDHHVFQIPDAFVVGYGLDYNDDYRHLPHIAVLEPSELNGN